MTDKELIAAVNWYKHHHGGKPVEKSVFTTFICGHFHTFPRRATEIMDDMKDLGLINSHKGIVTLKEQ
jgi:hypothetical protein